MPKYVVSATMTDPQWQNSTVLSEDPVQEIGALKEQPGQHIVVNGSIRLCHTLITAGLVDEYRLFVYPVVQGRGRRLFPDGLELPKLTLLEAKSFSGGVTPCPVTQRAPRPTLPEIKGQTNSQLDGPSAVSFRQ